ncbi:unnamed protein product [Dibothriocephalus latus]|uniref:Uncharacterized protein n=1 Tax=Dibothriocephalus latus TaxID=60516 RepID=A0A3P7PD36_DIBLA|nr:unnamed protein product [Dibothriocephalus latus]
MASTLYPTGSVHNNTSFDAPPGYSVFFASDRAMMNTKLVASAEGTTSNSADDGFGTGTGGNPINLIQGQLSGVHSVEIECSTTCASQPTLLRWTIRNGV